jgi:hypothetical protein
VSVVVAVVIIALLAAVIALVAHPLLAPRRRGSPLASERAELEAAREAKYREIRDAELDYRTGKLSSGDFAAIDAALRAEGLEILQRLDALPDRQRAGERS